LIFCLPSTSTLLPYTTPFRSRRLVRQSQPAPRRRHIGDELFRLRQSIPALRCVRPPLRLTASRLGEVSPAAVRDFRAPKIAATRDRKSTRLNSSHLGISYAVF